ncbi:ATP-binding protein [Microbispora catharanthi]|uniref:ATP-binding protein n=1 Tax=Microbispora catharanthi TaxID=1712871 RepID=UPI00137830A1|nr:tetratricopeptide repeat protein [Microbispora catharanthi]
MAATRNTISGGLFLSAVIQGHTVTVQLPPQVTPALSGAPPRTEAFTGRDDELSTLLGLLDPARDTGAGTRAEPDRPRAALVTGLGGAGKTELALQAAHLARERGWFPGGVLFTDLRGYADLPCHCDVPSHAEQHGRDERPNHDQAAQGRQRGARPGEVLGELLRALGLDPERVPPGTQDRSRLFATVLDAYAEQGRPILLVLDNASSAEQVRPLLPGTGKALITSRHTLDVGARLLDLGMLAPGAAVELLARALRLALGDADTRVAREPAAAADIAGLCAGLPLAVRIVAALLAADPARPLRAMAEDLEEAATRLDELSYEDRGVRAAFELSYRHLEAEEARMFRLMTAAPGPDLSVETAAVVADRGPRDARRLLEALHRAHLVERGGAYGRWRMHDLVRLYAEERARDQAGPDRHEEACDRLLDHCCARARAAGAWLSLPEAQARRETQARQEAQLQRESQARREEFASREEAVTWLDAEGRTLVAAVTAAAGRGDRARSHALAVDLAPYFEFRQRTGEWITTALAAVDAAGRLGHHAELAAAMTLGNAYRLARRYDESAAQLRRALSLARDDRARSPVLHNLGLTYLRMGALAKAEACHRRDRRICALAGDLRGRAQAAVALGDALRARRRHPEAAKVLTEAVTLLQRLDGLGLGNRTALMHARVNLALTYLAGRPDRTPTYILWQLCAALAAARDLDDRHAQALIFMNLSTAYRNRCAACHGPSALAWGRRAVTLFEELGDSYHRARALTALGLAAGPEEARRSLAEALSIFEDLGAGRECREVRALSRTDRTEPPRREACTADESEQVRDWVDDLPHAVLRGDDERLGDVLIPGCNIG